MQYWVLMPVTIRVCTPSLFQPAIETGAMEGAGALLVEHPIGPPTTSSGASCQERDRQRRWGCWPGPGGAPLAQGERHAGRLPRRLMLARVSPRHGASGRGEAHLDVDDEQQRAGRDDMVMAP